MSALKFKHRKDHQENENVLNWSLYSSFPQRVIAVLIKLSVSLAAQGGRSYGQASPSGSATYPLALDTLSPPPHL